MPSPAEQPYGARPWWREPLPPEELEGPAPGPAPGATGERTGPRPPGPAGPAPSAGEPPVTAGPADETVVMQPLPDATRELPPVPPHPAAFAGPATAPGGPAPVAPAPGGGQQAVPAPSGRQPSAPAGRQPSAPPPGDAQSSGGPWPAGAAPISYPSAAETETYAPVSVPAQDPAGARTARRSGPWSADRDRRTTLVTLGGAALVLLLVVAGAGLLVSRLRNTPPSTSPSASVTPVDLTGIDASASSVQKTDGTVTYGADNTLDGKLNTAWNSNGAVDGPGPGITVTYRFPAKVDLRTITIRNGYQKVRPNGIDLWERNERVKQVEVTTDAGHWTWNLQDVRDPQTLRQDFGRTGSVRLKITGIYPGTRYRDVAISEISFGAAAS